MPPRCRSSFLCLLLASVFILVANLAELGEARPSYKLAFDKTYPLIAKKRINCYVCHLNGDDMKHFNHYDEALAKELGEKKVKDEKKIIGALKAIEDGECRSGQWKVRLEKGLPPCVCRIHPNDSTSYIVRQLERDCSR